MPTPTRDSALTSGQHRRAFEAPKRHGRSSSGAGHAAAGAGCAAAGARTAAPGDPARWAGSLWRAAGDGHPRAVGACRRPRPVAQRPTRPRRAVRRASIRGVARGASRVRRRRGGQDGDQVRRQSRDRRPGTPPARVRCRGLLALRHDRRRADARHARARGDARDRPGRLSRLWPGGPTSRGTRSSRCSGRSPRTTATTFTASCEGAGHSRGGARTRRTRRSADRRGPGPVRSRVGT